MNPKLSFSAEGEDILVQKIFERMFFEEELAKVYVDVGAYDPWVNSNTASLWLNGWTGVNVDCRQGSNEAFHKVRPGDFNCEVACSEADGFLTYLEFDRPELNRIDPNRAPPLDLVERGSRLLTWHPVAAWTLDRLLAGTPQVDFLSIDVEEHELEVLKGFEEGLCSPYSMTGPVKRPMVICVEILCSSMQKFLRHPVVRHLEDRGYVCLSRLHCSAIFVDEARAVFR